MLIRQIIFAVFLLLASPLKTFQSGKKDQFEASRNRLRIITNLALALNLAQILVHVPYLSSKKKEIIQKKR